jgi:hypothetical protein
MELVKGELIGHLTERADPVLFRLTQDNCERTKKPISVIKLGSY